MKVFHGRVVAQEFGIVTDAEVSSSLLPGVLGDSAAFQHAVERLRSDLTVAAPVIGIHDEAAVRPDARLGRLRACR